MNEPVQFKLDGFSCQGELNLEERSFCLNMYQPVPNISYTPRKITCFAQTHIYVLYDNEFSSKRVLPAFVIKDYEYNAYSCFEMDLDGLQDFLSVSEFHDGFVFCENVEIGGVKYSCECANSSDYTTVRVKTVGQWEPLEKIEGIVQKFIQFFSLISYKKITCTSVKIIDGNQKYEIYTLIQKKYTGDKNWCSSLLHAGLICSKKLWKGILRNFFEKEDGKEEIFQKCLTGILAQVESDLFWEYKIINICGIWDQYSRLVEMASLKDKTKYKKPPLLTRFEKIYSELDSRIRAVFPAAKEDLVLLKECRDNTAHGENFSLPQKIFEVYYQAFRRMRLMTVIFVYSELGIPIVDIYKGFRHCFHSCVLNANLDKFLLSSIIGDTPLFNVDSRTWSFLLQPRVFPCLKYDVYEGLLKIDIDTTMSAFDRSLKGKEKVYHSYIKQVNREYQHPIMLSSIFIQYKEFHRELCGAFVLNYNDLPADLRAVCEYQRCNMEPIRTAEE